MNYSDRENGVLSSNTPHVAGFTIALTIRSFDPLECRREEESCSIDIGDLYRTHYPFA